MVEADEIIACDFHHTTAVLLIVEKITVMFLDEIYSLPNPLEEVVPITSPLL